ncbi:MAG: hypothetical protein JSS70_09655 [Bacteroidetes bacterium]|nr:hypothetical protein [Bacteroidota bacterium]
MKRFLLLLTLNVSLFLTGCLEETQELTVAKDGTGTFSSTTDMSQMINMAMQMAGDKLGDQKINMDTAINFKSILDSVKDISPENKQLLKDGLVHVTMKMDGGKYLINSSIPFKKMGDVEKINNAMQKEVNGKFLDNAMKEAMKQGKAMDSSMMGGMGNQPVPALSMPENYFVLTCKDGLISRVADKAKLASLADDEMMNQMKQMSSMGAPLKSNFVINLPRPAKKVEGKNVKVSDDKKKITIANELDDLFDDPALFEFKVEY